MNSRARPSASASASIERLAPVFSRWTLIAVIVVAVLALGSIPAPALLGVAALATLSAAAALLGRGLGTASLPAPAWLILGLTLYTAIQALPLPAGLVGVLAPANREVWDGAFEVLGKPSALWLPLSLDPGATWLEVVKGWLYACVFIAAAAAGARRGAGFGATVILGSVFVFAIVCLGHGLSEATRVFGVYTPTTRGSGLAVAPLLNPNNRASYLNLGFLCGVSLLLMRHPPLSRWLIGLAISPILGLSLLSGSRGGLLGLFVGCVFLFVLLRPTRKGLRGDAIQIGQLLPMGAAVTFVGAAFALAASGGKLRHLLFEQNTSKLAVMAVSVQLLPVHFWSGIGRGSFESVFPALRTAGDNTIASHPENFVMQWATEWGVPVTLLALALVAVLFRPRNWGVRNSIPACGLLCGAAALAFQNLVDLGSEVPGIVVAGTAAAGFALGARRGKSSRAGGRGFSLSLIALSLGALVVWAGARHGQRTLDDDRDWLRDRRSSGESWPAFRDDVAQVILRHPAEPYFPRLAAIAAWKSGTENPLPWIGRALSRGMGAGRTHYLLGGYLGSHGKLAQALLELRLAATYDPAMSGAIAKLALQLTQEEDALQRCVPEGPGGAPLLTALANNLRLSQPALATSLLRQAVARDPEAAGARLALVRRLLEDVEGATPACADAGACLNEASRLLKESKATNAEIVKLRARVLMASGDSGQAVRLLADECRRMEHPVPCIASWVEAARRARDRKGLHQAVLALESEDCSAGKPCDPIFWAAGQAAAMLGDNDFALRYLERAANGQRSATRWREVARVARESGQAARAAGALTRARLLDPSDPSISRELDSVRRDSVEQMLRK